MDLPRDYLSIFAELTEMTWTPAEISALEAEFDSDDTEALWQATITEIERLISDGNSDQ